MIDIGWRLLELRYVVEQVPELCDKFEEKNRRYEYGLTIDEFIFTFYHPEWDQLCQQWWDGLTDDAKLNKLYERYNTLNPIVQDLAKAIEELQTKR